MRLKTSAPQARLPTKGGGSIPAKGASTRAATKGRAGPQQSQKQIARPQAQKTVPRTRTRGAPAVKGTRAKNGERVLAEIRKLQRSTELLVRKAAVYRLIKEIARSFKGDVRFGSEAISALHEALESYGIHEFTAWNKLAAHAGRITVMPPDIAIRKDLNKFDGTGYHPIKTEP